MKIIYLISLSLFTSVLSFSQTSELEMVDGFEEIKFSEFEKSFLFKDEVYIVRSFYNPPVIKYLIEKYDKQFNFIERIDMKEILPKSRNYKNCFWFGDDFYVISEKREKSYSTSTDLFISKFDLKSKVLGEDIDLDLMGDRTSKQRCRYLNVVKNEESNEVYIALCYSEGILDFKNEKIKLIAINSKLDILWEQSFVNNDQSHFFSYLDFRMAYRTYLSTVEQWFLSKKGELFISGNYVNFQNKEEKKREKKAAGFKTQHLIHFSKDGIEEFAFEDKGKYVLDSKVHVDDLTNRLFIYGVSSNTNEGNGDAFFIKEFTDNGDKVKDIISHDYTAELKAKFLPEKLIQNYTVDGKQVNLDGKKMFPLKMNITEQGDFQIVTFGVHAYVSVFSNEDKKVRSIRLPMGQNSVFISYPIVYFIKNETNVLYNDNIGNHSAYNSSKGTAPALFNAQGGIITKAVIGVEGELKKTIFNNSKEANWSLWRNKMTFEIEGAKYLLYNLIQPLGKYRLGILKL